MTYAGAVPLTIPPLNYEGSPIWSSSFLFTPNFCDCTFHGRCETVMDYMENVNRSICICDEGWTGFSDFMDARGASCHVNEDVIKYLWVTNLALWLIVLLSIIPMMRDLTKKHLESQRKLRAKGRSFHVWDNQGFLSILLALIVVMPFMVAVGIVRLASPHSRVAIDWIISWFWLMGRIGIGLATSIHQPALMRQMLQAQSVASEIIREYDRRGKILAAVQAAATLWALPVLITHGQNVQLTRACFSIFCGHVSLCFFMLSRQATVLRTTLFKILTESAQVGGNPFLISIRDRLCSGQRKIQRQTLLQALLYLVWFAAPPLWLTYDYLLPISWLTPPILLRNVVTAIHDERGREGQATGVNTRAGRSSKKSNDPGSATPKRQRDDDEDGRKPFQLPSSSGQADEMENQSRYVTSFQATQVVEVQDTDDRLLLSTGAQWSRLNVLRSLVTSTPGSEPKQTLKAIPSHEKFTDNDNDESKSKGT